MSRCESEPGLLKLLKGRDAVHKLSGATSVASPIRYGVSSADVPLLIPNFSFLVEAPLTAESYLERVRTALAELDTSPIRSLVAILCSAKREGRTVFLAGNGGSAATVNHIAVDWMLGASGKNSALRVVSLASSPESLTATGNDLDFTEVFARQLDAMARPRDALVLLSASGNSPNLIKLAETAQKCDVSVCSLTGFDGGWLATNSDLNIHVPTAVGDYGVVEDVHLTVGHLIKEALLADENGS